LIQHQYHPQIVPTSQKIYVGKRNATQAAKGKISAFITFQSALRTESCLSEVKVDFDDFPFDT